MPKLMIKAILLSELADNLKPVWDEETSSSLLKAPVAGRITGNNVVRIPTKVKLELPEGYMGLLVNPPEMLE